MAKTKVKVIVALFAVIALSLLAVCFGRLFSPAEAKAADGTYDDTAAVALMQDLITDGQATLTENVVFDLTVPSTITGSGTMEENGHMDIVGNKTIDLAGFTLTIITGSENCCVEVTPNASLTIKDSSAAGTGKVVGQSAGDFAWGQTGTSISLTNVDVEFTSTETGAAGDEGTTPGGSSEDHVILFSGSVELSGVTFDTNVSDPVAVFTKDAETGEFVGSDVTYGTLQDAINAGETSITLDKDYTESITVSKGQNVTIDLNGFTLTNVANEHTVTNYGTLTVKDGSEEKTGTVDNVSNGCGSLVNYGVASVNSGNIVRGETAQGSWYVIKNYGYMTLGTNAQSAVKVDTNSDNSSLIANGYFDGTDKEANESSITVTEKARTLVINGGTYTNGMNAVKNDDEGVLTINNGSFTNNYTEPGYNGAVILTAGTMNINGGKFTQINGSSHGIRITTSGDDVKVNIGGGEFSEYAGVYLMHERNSTGGKLDVTISGGTFDGKIETDNVIGTAVSGTDTIAITGGTFNNDLSLGVEMDVAISGGDYKYIPNNDYLADEVKMYQYTEGAGAKNDLFVIVAPGEEQPENTVATGYVQAGKKGYYNTLAEALAAGESSVYLRADITESVTYTGGYLTIYLEGHTWTADGDQPALTNNNASSTLNIRSTKGYDGGAIVRTTPGPVIVNNNSLSFSTSSSGKYTVKNESNGDYALIENNGTISITSGSFDSASALFDNKTAGSKITIMSTANGTFTAGTNIVKNNLGTVKISAGTFNKTVDKEYIAAGYTSVNNGDGTFGVVKVVAQIVRGEETFDYTDFATAVAALQDNDTLIILASVSGGLTIDDGLTVTLEVYGTLSGGIINNGTLTIRGDGTVEGTVTNNNNASLKIESGEFESLFVANGKDISITGGTFKGGANEHDGDSYLRSIAEYLAEGYYFVSHSGTTGNMYTVGQCDTYAATVTDGDFTLNVGTLEVAAMYVRYSAATSDVTITLNDDVTPAKSIAFYQGGDSEAKNVTLDLNGHSVTFDSGKGFTVGGSSESQSHNITIEGSGKVDGTMTVKYGTLKIKGGTYTANVESYLAEGYVQQEDGSVILEAAVGAVAQIGDMYYKDLKTAIEAAAENATITLLADVTESVTIAADDVITLDLNGKTIKNTAGQHTVTNNGMLTIVGNGTVDNVSHGRAALLNNPNATMTVLGGTYRRTAENAGNNSFYVIQNKGTMTIGGTGASDIVVYAGATTEGSLALRKSSLVTSGWYSDAPDGGAASLTINSGNFYGGNIAIKCDEKTSLTINCGVFNAYNQAVQSWTNTKITNGTFNGIVAAWTLVDNTTGEMIETPSALDITGGTFNGAIVANRYVYLPDDEYATEVNDNADVDISGGEFSMAFNSDFLAEGADLYVNDAGEYIVSKNEVQGAQKVIAMVGDKAYGSLQEAISKAQDGDTVVLYDDLEYKNANTTQISKKIMVNLNGHTLNWYGSNSNLKQAVTMFRISKAEVTFTNGTIVYAGNNSVYNKAFEIRNNGTLIVDNVDIDFTGCEYVIDVGNYNKGNPVSDGGNLVLNDSTVKGGSVASIAVYGTKAEAENGSSVKATGSIIEGTVYGIATNGSFSNNSIVLEGTNVKAGSTGTGMYLPGDGSATITGGSVEGGTGIEVRAGSLTIDGTAVTATGAYTDPVANGDGTTTMGVAVAVSQHTTNKNINVEVKDGTFAAADGGKAFLEVDTVEDETSPSGNVTIALAGGNFTAPVESKNKTGFVEGGNFSEVLDSAYLDENVNMYVSEGKYAAATEDNKPDGAELVVAVIGTKGYTSLNAAIADVKAGAASQFSEETTVITLMTDTKDSSDIGTSNGQAPKNVTIDLNGHTLTLGPGVGSAGTETAGLRVLAYSTLTVKNGTLKCSDDTADHIWVGIANYGKTTLENVTLDAAEVTQYPVNNRGELTLKGDTTVENGGVYDIAITNDPYNYYYKDVNASLNIADPEVTVGTVRLELYGNATNNGVPVLNVSAGTLQTIITDGNNAIGFESNVSGATFEELPDAGLIGDSDMYQTADGKFKASDSTVEGATKVIAMVDDKAYDDLNEAIANANGQTVELYKDVENITVASDSDVTIDLNGNSAGKITVNAPTTKAAGGTVTFTDGYASSLVANGSSVALENVAFGGTGKGNAITLHEGATVAMNGGSISSYDIGIYVGKRGEAVSSLTVTGVEFSDIPSKGIYGEAIGDLSVTDNIFGTTGTGTGGSLPEMQRSSAAIDINQTMAGGNVTISGNKFNNCGTEDGSTSGAVKIKVRNIPVEQAAGQAGDFEKGATYVGSFESITVSGNTYTGCVRDIVLGTGYVAETVPSSDVLTITEAETVKVTDFGRVDDEEALKGALADTDLTVIKLAGDVELTEAVAVSRAVTIDLNGYDITGNINVTAADVTITAPETSDSAINGIVTVTNADDFTLSNVTVNYTVTGEEEADSLKGAVVIDGSENATIDNVTVNVTANYSGLNVVSVWVKNDSTATISDSTIDLKFRATEENRTQGQVVRAETSDLTIKDSVITTTDYGVIFYGDMSATDAQADNIAAFDKLVIENSTVTVTDTDEIVGAYAVSGNGSNRNGTIIEITGSTITSDVATAIYHPQYGNMTITDSVITGASGIEMRSGNLTVTSGTITATGDFEVEPNGNGNTASGVAVAVSQHTTEMKINVQLNGGTFNATGENGKAFYETDTVTGADPSADVTVDLNGGTYEAAVEAKNIKNFINDGLYKEEPKEDAFAEGYEGVLYNGYYQVVEATSPSEELNPAKIEAQADVRSYLGTMLGMTIADVKALAADETLGAAAQAVIDAYAAMDGATSLSKLAIARLSVMDAIDALDKALDTALADYKAAAIDEINSYGAKKDVAVPTATIMAINSAKTEAEVDMYKEYAIGEIDDIVAYREAISNIEIPDYSDTLDALSDKLDTLTGNLTSVSNTLGEKIDAVKTDIATVTADIDKLETTLAGLADSDDVNGIAEDISDIIEQLAAIKSTVDGISVAVDEATAVEEVKTEAAAEIDAWLEDYIDSIVESSATSVRDILTAKAAMADDLRSKLVDAFGEDNAALIEKYYDDAMSAIENATSASEATNAVSTFKAQVASVEAAAGNTTSLAGVYVLLAIILVVAIVAVVLAVVLKRKGGEPAPATAQPAPEAAPAPAPAAETAPAPAATEEAPAAQPEDESAATATDEDTERVVITASTRTFEEAYEALDPELRDLFDKVKAYALSKNGTTEVKLSNCICIKYGSKKVVRLTVRRSYPLAMFVIENEMVKDFRRNATGALKLKVPATELVIRDEEDLKAAYSMVDLAVDQILKDIEAAKERRRAARRARRAQREAEAGEAGETPEAPEAPDDGGKK